ncbi:hypothetical protein [Rhodohalobacter barkolensis]|uniref:Outer membrane protein beta-barrel domain-containing protein n=1 Tax=Rhodohalobacter barkolensis TaxID=2053187 RepID=A0A2N0VHA5_9BACT|nr:hypothetical protein [Rhodohalobacter barkolensis]PKD43570.1 hypothetical protein CWD77_08355 [Rhodohalobacter barkolensis]
MYDRGISISFIVFIAFTAAISLPIVAHSQTGIGGGLDIRSEAPTSGYSLRLEYRVLKLPPVADLRIRVHGSYFSETKKVSYEMNGLSTDVFEEKSAFDVGSAALAGFNLGLIKPYTGIGLGLDSSEFVTARSLSNPNRLEGINEENLFWNLFFGAELDLIPYVKPFFEYRFIQLVKPKNIDFKDSERFSMGVMLRF